MRTVLALTPLAAVSALLAGCTDPDVGGPTPYRSDTAAAFCRSTWALYADRLVACNEVASEAAAFGPANHEGTCAVLEASVAEGRITYAPPAGAACLSALQARSCPELRANDDLFCATPFTGTVAISGACTIGNDCASGWCDVSGTCPGVCLAWAREGEGCSSGSCAPGLTCGPGGTCVAEPPPGAAGDGCSSSDECAPGLTCGGTTLECQAPGPEGAACASPTDCAVGLGCAATETCQPNRAAGSACDTPNAACIPGTTCDGNTCQLLPVDGQPCDQGPWPCLGAWCDAGTCRAHRADGAACASDVECGPGGECAGTCRRVVCP